MKNPHKIFFAALLLLISSAATTVTAQTKVSGGIYANTKWTLAKSPYQVTGDVTLFPNDTLTIEPGVVVKFDKDVVLEIRGYLISVGTATDSIEFTSSSSTPYQGIWVGIKINIGTSASATIKYNAINYSSVGFIITGTDGNSEPINIKQCKFENNNVAIDGHAGMSNRTRIDGCYFSKNTTAIYAGYKNISNCTFINNNYGIYQANQIDILNTKFCSNKVALYEVQCILKNCVIMNNGKGIVQSNQNFQATNNIITLNDTGIVLDGECRIDSNNKICNNIYYNMVHTTSKSIYAKNTCWCDTNKANIAKKIYDGYDDISLGIIDFSNYLNCDTSAIPKTNCQNTVITAIEEVNQDKISISLSPNPMHEYAILRTNTALHNANIGIYNLVGQKLIELRNQSGNEFSLNKGQLQAGLYFIKITAQGNSVGVVKMVVR
ncbi:MAG: T9SS type A sorting domain-containing protein [Bacteroidetes bacterium]|nr:T9SS type A sorting domain-containing protein [Bacteroidota bacterium]